MKEGEQVHQEDDQIPIPRVLRLAAIDMGSNAVRMSIAESFCPQFHRVIKYSRKPLRLGESVFSQGKIDVAATHAAIEYFKHFRDLLWKYNVDYHLAVGTSALREASNKDEFIEQIKHHTNLLIKVISGEEEADLVFQAVTQKVPLLKPSLLLDIGGGSLELSYVKNEKVLAQATYPMGALRALQWMHSQGFGDLDSKKVAIHYRPFILKFIQEHLKDLEPPQQLVGTGGNCERYAQLEAWRLGKPESKSFTLKDLKLIHQTLASMDLEERSQKFKIALERADVMIPAGAILQMVMEEFNCQEMLVPAVGAKDGLLYYLAQKAFA